MAAVSHLRSFRAASVLLLALLCTPPEVLAASAKPKPAYNEIAEIDPQNPRGLRPRRPRRAAEGWADYFVTVFLWPYDREHYNRFWSTFGSGGSRVQFLSETIFASEGKWYVALRGARRRLEDVVPGVTLHTGDRRFVLRPTSVAWREDPAEAGQVIALLSFAPPEAAPNGKWQSAFAAYGQAGGVAEVRDEAAARRHYAMLRDFAEVAEEINRAAQEQRR